MIKRLVLCILLAAFAFIPLFADDVFFPGTFTISLSGSASPLFSFEPTYDLLPQLFLTGEAGLHIGGIWGGSFLFHAGFALPSALSSASYRYSGFEEYGIGLGAFYRQRVSSALYFEYLCKIYANLAWQPEKLLMYFFGSVVPEFCMTPAFTSWRFGSLQGCVSFPIEFHQDFYSFGLGLSVRFHLTPWSKEW